MIDYSILLYLPDTHPTLSPIQLCLGGRYRIRRVLRAAFQGILLTRELCNFIRCLRILLLVCVHGCLSGYGSGVRIAQGIPEFFIFARSNLQLHGEIRLPLFCLRQTIAVILLTVIAIRNTIESYVAFYNKQRPCYAIGYDTPDHYYQRFQRGELEKKDTFSKRVLTTEPKFVQKRKLQKLRDKEKQGIEGIQMTVSTSENGNGEKMSLVSTAEKEES